MMKWRTRIQVQIHHPCLVLESRALTVPSQLKSQVVDADVLQCRYIAVVGVAAAVSVVIGAAAVAVVVVEQPVEWLIAAAMVADFVGAESWEKAVIVSAEVADAVGAAAEE